MKYEIDFNKERADLLALGIVETFHRSEDCFKANDLPRNIRNVCAFQAALRELILYGADVDSTGIYNDNGFDRIGYARINEHEFIKKGQLNYNELWAALREIREGVNAE